MMAAPPRRLILFFVIASVGCAIDLATKEWIFSRLGMPSPFQQPIWVVDDVFSLTTSLNEGALFGLGQGMSFVFAGLSIVAAIAILGWVIFGGAAKELWLTIALGCILAGILGNLYDRLGLHGLVWQRPPRAGEPVYAVRDWLHFRIEGIIDWPVFNIADSLLVCGAALIVLLAMRPAPASPTELGSKSARADAVIV